MALPTLIPKLRAALIRPEERAATEARFALSELSGRLVELRGSALTCAVGLVLEAQQRGEPCAYVCGPEVSFYPVDVAESGVDLAALAVIRVKEATGRGRVADELARSGAFALIVVDLLDADGSLPPALLTRLHGLAQRHLIAMVFLTKDHQMASALGSLVSLRAVVHRKRAIGPTVELSLEVSKDKRRAPGWTHTALCRAPLGLR